jgi:hypothetical protein
MIDPFVLLAPVLLLGVIALLRFVGCNYVLGLHDTTLAPHTPVLKPPLSPPFATQGDPNFTTLTVTGVGFVPPTDPHNPNDPDASRVQWNGNDLPTAFFSDMMLAATITPDLIATAGQAQITVFTPNATPDPTSNAVPFTIDSSAVIVHLENRTPPGNADDPLNGVFQNLDFASGTWFWKGAGGGNSIFLGPAFDAGPHTGSFSFANTPPTGRRLLRVRVIADPNLTGTITIQDGVNPSLMQIPVPAGAPPTFIETGWGNGNLATTVTVTSDIGWDISIDTIIYQGPA